VIDVATGGLPLEPYGGRGCCGYRDGPVLQHRLHQFLDDQRCPYPGITRKFWSFRRFVEAFYDALASGARVGDATLEGQRKLKDDTFRGRAMAIEVNDVIWLARASGAVEFLAQVLSPPTLPAAGSFRPLHCVLNHNPIRVRLTECVLRTL
jgi:hypothetical protein